MVDIVEFPGLVPYSDALSTMRETHSRRVAGDCADTILFMEHPPVITLGRNAPDTGVTSTMERLAAIGVEVHRIERGGQATCHLPGQLVAYPIVNLRSRGLGVRRFTLMVEEAMILAAEEMGVLGRRLEGQTGVWCDKGKIGAVGIAVSSGVTLHGMAFNVACDLSFYGNIIPCGRPDLAPSSISESLGREVSTELARSQLKKAMIRVFGS